MTQTATSVNLKGRDFLTVADFSRDEILAVLTYARDLKAQKKARKPHRLLDGRSVALYFEKPSNRTRVSFEVALADLGAHPIHLRKEEINLGVRETIADTARTLSRYVEAIMIRTFQQIDVEELAKWASVPVINGLTNEHHPCQILADLQTIQEHFGTFEGHQLTFMGDGSSNMAHSLMEGCALVGLNMVVAGPDGYQPMPAILEKARKIAAQNGCAIEVTTQASVAVEGASIVYTDVWASMGFEAEAEQRRAQMQPFQVSSTLMAKARPDAIVLHCLPAHRGEEIAHDVIEQHAEVIFSQAENRMHAQKALLAMVVE